MRLVPCSNHAIFASLVSVRAASSLFEEASVGGVAMGFLLLCGVYPASGEQVLLVNCFLEESMPWKHHCVVSETTMVCVWPIRHFRDTATQPSGILWFDVASDTLLVSSDARALGETR